jgi:hypothetical protein
MYLVWGAALVDVDRIATCARLRADPYQRPIGKLDHGTRIGVLDGRATRGQLRVEGLQVGFRRYNEGVVAIARRKRGRVHPPQGGRPSCKEKFFWRATLTGRQGRRRGLCRRRRAWGRRPMKHEASQNANGSEAS